MDIDIDIATDIDIDIPALKKLAYSGGKTQCAECVLVEQKIGRVNFPLGSRMPSQRR